jgi:hypothetical protein
MAVPNSSEANSYYRCALRRYEEAEVLSKAGYTTGAVYLAGYGVECILKTLALMAVPTSRRPKLLKSFRGSQTHDYEWLRSTYLTNGGARFPKDVTRHFTVVNSWSTDLRYYPRALRADEADAFMTSALAIIQWADGRI